MCDPTITLPRVLLRSNGAEASEQKQSAVTKAHAEMHSITVKIEELTEALDEADKGREDTVCPLS